VPQQTARRMDGAMLAVGALSDILKQKVGLQSCQLFMPPCSRLTSVHMPLLNTAGCRSTAMQHCSTLRVYSSMQDNYKKSLEGMLMTHVLPLFQSSHGHLRAKAAWVSPCWRCFSSLLTPAVVPPCIHADIIV
jgi:hypothetical protein